MPDRTRSGNYSVMTENIQVIDRAYINMYTCDVVSKNLTSGETSVIVRNNPSFPMVYDGKVFYYRFQKEPLLIGDVVDEDSGERKRYLMLAAQSCMSVISMGRTIVCSAIFPTAGTSSESQTVCCGAPETENITARR